jgi:hypothetical protein
MSGPSETVSESIKYLGQGFLLAYYLPSLAFVLVNCYVLFPASNASPNPPPWAVDPSTLVIPLLFSLIVGITLFVLNGILIKSFEGKPDWLKNGLLLHLTKRNEKECSKLYGDLVAFRKDYLARQENTEDPHDSFLVSYRKEIIDEHKKIEEKQKQTLPHSVERVCPTSFGNAYAIAEEYSYERYGADAVLFWPHLRILMQEKAASHFLRLTQQKTVLDLSINFAFLTGLITVETILEFIFLDHNYSLLKLAGIAFILSISFYQASVAAIQGLGGLIKVSFDYYRGFVLQAFNLRTPDNLIDEQAVWVKLAAFLQRGEAFQFPEEYRETKKGGDGTEEKKIDE